MLSTAYGRTVLMIDKLARSSRPRCASLLVATASARG